MGLGIQSLLSAGRLLRLASHHPVSRRQPLRTLARIVDWQFRSRTSRGPHRETWIGGASLSVERGMTAATGNLYFGLYEFADMAFLLHFLREDDDFLDIGANVGTFTVLAAKLCRANVVAFEPDPETAARFERNLTENAIERRVLLHRLALGAVEGPAGFTTGLGAMNHVASDESSADQIVEMRRLDTLVDGLSPILIKLDVEGHEEAVLDGATATLASPALLAIEAETVSDRARTMLLDHGFARYYYDPLSRSLATEPFAVVAHNHLYLRDVDAVRARLSTAPRFDVLGLAV